MIFLERDGGGGSVKPSAFLVGRADELDCFRLFVSGEYGDAGRYEESEPLADGVVDEVRSLVTSPTAEGPRLRAGASVKSCVLPRMSDDDPGVGGRLTVGILVALIERRGQDLDGSAFYATFSALASFCVRSLYCHYMSTNSSRERSDRQVVHSAICARYPSGVLVEVTLVAGGD